LRPFINKREKTTSPDPSKGGELPNVHKRRCFVAPLLWRGWGRSLSSWA
jgi:hypothetical protein